MTRALSASASAARRCAAPPAPRAGRRRARDRRPLGLRLQPRRTGSARPRSTSPAPGPPRQRHAARTLRRLGALRDPAARARRARSTARARSWSARCAPRPAGHHALALGPRRGRPPAARARARPWSSPTSTSTSTEAVNDTVAELNAILERDRSTPPVRATQTGYATLSRAIQDESIRRRRAQRADRAADPADRPPARLPLAGRGGDPARLRRRRRRSPRAACSTSSPAGSTSTPSRSPSAR